MDNTQVSTIFSKIFTDLVDNGKVTIELGTPESAALIEVREVYLIAEMLRNRK